MYLWFLTKFPPASNFSKHEVQVNPQWKLTFFKTTFWQTHPCDLNHKNRQGRRNKVTFFSQSFFFFFFRKKLSTRKLIISSNPRRKPHGNFSSKSACKTLLFFKNTCTFSLKTRGFRLEGGGFRWRITTDVSLWFAKLGMSWVSKTHMCFQYRAYFKKYIYMFDKSTFF